MEPRGRTRWRYQSLPGSDPDKTAEQTQEKLSATTDTLQAMMMADLGTETRERILTSDYPENKSNGKAPIRRLCDSRGTNAAVQSLKNATALSAWNSLHNPEEGQAAGIDLKHGDLTHARNRERLESEGLVSGGKYKIDGPPAGSGIKGYAVQGSASSSGTRGRASTASRLDPALDFNNQEDPKGKARAQRGGAVRPAEAASKKPFTFSSMISPNRKLLEKALSEVRAKCKSKVKPKQQRNWPPAALEGSEALTMSEAERGQILQNQYLYAASQSGPASQVVQMATQPFVLTNPNDFMSAVNSIAPPVPPAAAPANNIALPLPPATGPATSTAPPVPPTTASATINSAYQLELHDSGGISESSSPKEIGASSETFTLQSVIKVSRDEYAAGAPRDDTNDAALTDGAPSPTSFMSFSASEKSEAQDNVTEQIDLLGLGISNLQIHDKEVKIGGGLTDAVQLPCKSLVADSGSTGQSFDSDFNLLDSPVPEMKSAVTSTRGVSIPDNIRRYHFDHGEFVQSKELANAYTLIGKKDEELATLRGALAKAYAALAPVMDAHTFTNIRPAKANPFTFKKDEVEIPRQHTSISSSARELQEVTTTAPRVGCQSMKHSNSDSASTLANGEQTISGHGGGVLQPLPPNIPIPTSEISSCSNDKKIAKASIVGDSKTVANGESKVEQRKVSTHVRSDSAEHGMKQAATEGRARSVATALNRGRKVIAPGPGLAMLQRDLAAAAASTARTPAPKHSRVLSNAVSDAESEL